MKTKYRRPRRGLLVSGVSCELKLQFRSPKVHDPTHQQRPSVWLDLNFQFSIVATQRKLISLDLI